MNKNQVKATRVITSVLLIQIAEIHVQNVIQWQGGIKKYVSGLHNFKTGYRIIRYPLFYMKLYLFFNFFILVTAFKARAISSDSNYFEIKGKIIGRTKGRIVLGYFDTSGRYVTDTQSIQKNRFQFQGYIKNPIRAFLQGAVKSRSVSDPNYTEFFISPGVMNLRVTENEFKQFTLKGSEAQAEKQKWEYQRQKIEDERLEYSLRIEQLKDSIANSKNIEFKKQFKKHLDSNVLQYKSFEPKLQEIDLNFIKQHPYSFISPYIIEPYLYTLDADMLHALYISLDYSVRESIKGEYVYKEIEKKKNSYPFVLAPLFSAYTYEGEKLELENYRYKSFVLLDFWASWCVPCRRTFPELKNVYKKYKNRGFEVIGISQDMDNSAWKRAIISDSVFIWKHVLIATDLKKTFSGSRNLSDIIEKYFVNGIPVQILIDRNGRIVKRWDGENPQNISELDSILNTELNR
jgi:thiol-disulfide isomerase/thioredoxin